MTFEQYVKEELAYYDEHPEEDDQITEAHSNSFVAFDLEYTTAEWGQLTNWTFLQQFRYKGVFVNPFFCIMMEYNTPASHASNRHCIRQKSTC